MPSKLHQSTIELLLSSMFQGQVDKFNHQFLFGKPGTEHWEHNLRAEIYVDRMLINLAALHVRQNGPHYLKSLSLEDVRSKLTKFMTNNYYTISHGNCLSNFKESYNERVKGSMREEITLALAESHIFNPSLHWSVFPLLAVTVDADFFGNNFCIIKPSSLAGDKFFTVSEESYISPEFFPPIKNFSGRKQYPSAWVCVKSPDVKASTKVAKVVLGAVALAITHSHRYMFSGREMFGGKCTFVGGATYSFSDNNLMPPLMYDVRLTPENSWFAEIDDKISSPTKTDIRQFKALEYFYRAWSLHPSERFPILCMTLDAIFGDASNATQSVIDAVISTLGTHIEAERVRLLMKLRGSVIHGGAPDVYESSKYAKYIRTYRADPIVDMERLTQACLREVIFKGKIRIQDNPNAKLIKQRKAAGTYKQPQTTHYII